MLGTLAVSTSQQPGLSLRSCHLCFKCRQVGNNGYRRDGTGACESGGAEGGWDVAKSRGCRREALEGVDTRGRWVAPGETKTEWQSVWEGCVWECPV